MSKVIPINTTPGAGPWMTVAACAIQWATEGCGGIGAVVKHLGILATTPEGAALCFRAFCQQGASVMGPHEHLPERGGPPVC
jgi:hypothetical protein